MKQISGPFPPLMPWSKHQKKQLATHRAKVNEQALCEYASALHGKSQCMLDPQDSFESWRRDTMYVDIRLRFKSCQDQWVARIPRREVLGDSPHCISGDVKLEAMALQFLKQHEIKIPTPKIHGYMERSHYRNKIRVSIILLDETPGHTLSCSNPSDEQLAKVYEQLVAFQDEIASHPFYGMGSPDKFIRWEATESHEYRDAPMPKKGEKDHFLQHYSDQLLKIDRWELFNRFPVAAIVMIDFLQRAALNGRFNAVDGTLDDGPFYLKQILSNNGDHILINASFNIVAVTNWAHSCTAPAYEIFGPSWLTANAEDIFQGRAHWTAKDVLYKKVLQERNSLMVKYWTGDVRTRHLNFGLGDGSDFAETPSSTWEEVLTRFQCLLKVLGECEEGFCWEDWRDAQIEQILASSGWEGRMLQELLQQTGVDPLY